MKKIIFATAILIASFNIMDAQTSTKVKPNAAKTTTKSKDADGIDGRMKGPNGEKVYIGEKGGRYYINQSGNKTYVEYGGKNKTKKAVKNMVKKLIK